MTLDSTKRPARTFVSLLGIPWLRHGIFGRAGGVSPPPWESLNLSASTGDCPERVAENRERLRRWLGAEVLTPQNQVHSCVVIAIDGPEGMVIARGPHDGQVTHTPGIGLLTLGADCPGILAVDPVRRALGVAHAGWRGSVGGIALELVRAMSLHYGSQAEDLIVGLGPAIGGCCYTIGEEVAEKIAAWPGGDRALTPAIKLPEIPRRADLRRLIQSQLQGVGVQKIEISPDCTQCRSDLFFSHRQSGGTTGRFGLGAVIVGG